jgi:hypothetical protein
VRYSAIDSQSRLQVDGIGPVRIGMALDDARAASGLAMISDEAGVCIGYGTDGAPAGLAFTARSPACGADSVPSSSALKFAPERMAYLRRNESRARGMRDIRTTSVSPTAASDPIAAWKATAHATTTLRNGSWSGLWICTS